MIRIITVNCNGLREPAKIGYLKYVLENNNIDICLLQETHIDNSKFGYSLERKLNYSCFWSFTENSRNKGVGILIKKDSDYHVSNFTFDPFGRYVVVDVIVNDYDIRLVSMYAPNNICERKQFFNDNYHLFMGTKPIILGGDFNCVQNLNLDKMGGNSDKGNDGISQLKNILDDFNLIDCFRKKFPNVKEFTWSSQGVSCRLDRFYISSCLFSNVKTIQHLMYTFSDQHMVLLDLLPFNHQRKGKSYWKFNSSLIEDPNFVDFMTIFLQNKACDYPDDENLLRWWDDFKLDIKLATIEYSKNRKKRERFLINYLQKEYVKMVNEGNITESDNIKNQIKAFEIEKLKGAIIRSKSLHLEGEKPSKYFLYRELNNTKKKASKKDNR